MIIHPITNEVTGYNTMEEVYTHMEKELGRRMGNWVISDLESMGISDPGDPNYGIIDTEYKGRGNDIHSTWMKELLRNT